MEHMWPEDIRALTLGDLIAHLEDTMEVTVQDGSFEDNDVFVRIIPDMDNKFVYTAEAHGIIKYQKHDIHFTTLIKRGTLPSILLNPVIEFDAAQRAVIENKALTTALKALNSDAVHEARTSIIKYQMLHDLIKILES